MPTYVTYGGAFKSSSIATSEGRLRHFCAGQCTTCTGMRNLIGLCKATSRPSDSMISKSKAYLLATNVEINEGRREKFLGRTVNIVSSVSNSNKRVVPANSGCQL